MGRSAIYAKPLPGANRAVAICTNELHVWVAACVYNFFSQDGFLNPPVKHIM